LELFRRDRSQGQSGWSNAVARARLGNHLGERRKFEWLAASNREPFARCSGERFILFLVRKRSFLRTRPMPALDVPDVPARAIRLSDGTLELIDSDAPHTYASFGADFSTLKRSCNPIYVSDDNTDPATFDNQEWIHTTYREGSTIHVLIHNEYHDPFAADCDPGVTSPSNPSWYNSITYATSVDNGLSFTHVAPPGHAVAPPSTVWNSAGPPPPYGYFEPSSIVQRTDGFYYAVFMAILQGSTATSICAMRTQTLADPTSWRAWDGTGFNLQMNDPYLGSATFCTIVGSPSPDIYEGLTYNTYLQKYLLTGGGAYFTLLTDLINWNVEQPMGLAGVPPRCLRHDHRSRRHDAELRKHWPHTLSLFHTF
jgi:hypothetical protein